MEAKNQTFIPFATELSCFSFLCSTDSEVTQRLKYTNKILLPESVLYSLRENDKLEFPLFFKVYNTQTKYGHVCGVEEFTAPPGVCHVPYQLMADISVNEGDTLIVDVTNGLLANDSDADGDDLSVLVINSVSVFTHLY